MDHIKKHIYQITIKTEQTVYTASGGVGKQDRYTSLILASDNPIEFTQVSEGEPAQIRSDDWLLDFPDLDFVYFTQVQ